MAGWSAVNATLGWAQAIGMLTTPTSTTSISAAPGPQIDYSGDPATVLSIRTAFLSPRWGRPEGLGCFSGSLPAPATTPACARDPGLLVDAVASLTASYGAASAAMWSAATTAANSASPLMNPALLPCGTSVGIGLDGANAGGGLVIGLPAGAASPQVITLTACGSGTGVAGNIALGVYDAFPGATLVGGMTPYGGSALVSSSGVFIPATSGFSTACASVAVTLWPPPTPATAASSAASLPGGASYLYYVAVGRVSNNGSSVAGTVTVTAACASGSLSPALPNVITLSFSGGSYYNGVYTADNHLAGGRIRWNNPASGLSIGEWGWECIAQQQQQQHNMVILPIAITTILTYLLIFGVPTAPHPFPTQSTSPATGGLSRATRSLTAPPGSTWWPRIPPPWTSPP